MVVFFQCTDLELLTIAGIKHLVKIAKLLSFCRVCTSRYNCKVTDEKLYFAEIELLVKMAKIER